MRRAAGIVILLAAFLGLAAGATADAIAGRHSDNTQALQAGVIAELNATRHEHGLAPLRSSPSLAAAAQQHSVEMATNGYFSHNSANGTSFDHRISRYYAIGRYRYWSVGENLLWSSPDVDPVTALRMWMNSPEHKANILAARWRQIGISAVHVEAAPGMYGGAPVTVITTDFGVRH